MKRIINCTKGSTVVTAPIVIAISIFFLAILLIYAVNYLMPFIWYEKLSSYSLRYTFIMEEYGYLTADEKANLINDLSTAGFDTDNVNITATEAPVDYGDPIFLNISYKYNFDLPAFSGNSLSTSKQNNELEMVVRRHSVSKR